MSNENETDKLQPPGEAPKAEKPAKPVPKKATGKAASAKPDSAEASGEAAAPVEKADVKLEAKKEALPPPPPPEPGPFAQLLSQQGFHPTALGSDGHGVEMLSVSAGELLAACECLKTHEAARFDLLVSVSGVDWKDRLEAVYHLYATQTFGKLVVKATAVEDKLPSVVSVWQTADWHERETYDLFGIVFEGHPNLKRILMPSDWVGFPMRKDYTVADPRLVWNER